MAKTLKDALDSIEREITSRMENISEAKRRQAEINDREEEERRELIAALQRQRVKPRYYESTWENFIADTPEKKRALANAKQAWRENLFLFGNHGTGKTHLAMCLAKEGATYRELSDIFRETRLNLDEEQEILDFYGGCRLLVIDEIGRQKYTSFETNLFFDIINRRWNNVLPTTVITNLTKAEFAGLYGTAVMDRLMPVDIYFGWESMRGAA